MSARLYFSCCKHCEHGPDDEIYPDHHEDTCQYGCNGQEE